MTLPAAAIPALMALLAGRQGAPTPTMSAEDGDAAFARLAASSGGTGLLNTPDEVDELARQYFGRTAPAPAAGATPAPPRAAAAPEMDIEEFLRQQLGKPARGGGSGGVSFAGVDSAFSDDRKALQALLSRIQSGRTAQGALEAGRPLTETFDSGAADKRLRTANPESRPNNELYWRGQNMPKWVGGEAGFASHGDPAGAARLMFDVDKRAETSYETKLAKLLGMEKEGVANQNLTAKEKHDRLLAPVLAQIPDKMEADLTKAMSKQGLEASKLSASAQMAAARANRDTKNEEQLKMAADLLRSGAIKQSDFLDLKKKLAGFGAAPGMKMSELKDLNEVAGGNPALMDVFQKYANKQLTPEQFVKAVTALNVKK